MNKKDVIEVCVDEVKKRMEEVELAIEEANSSLVEDTKSSAGDKYETGREMIQQDLNRFQQQLALAHNDLLILERIEHLKINNNVGLGALIQTEKDWYFIAVSIGKIVGIENLFVISPQSPIGKSFWGKQLGDSISFNKQQLTIKQLL